jgi:chromosome segregation ATPase
MGHIPTATVGALAAVLTGLYFVLPEAVHFTLLVFIIAAWFLTAICWLAQKSADYMHKHGSHDEIKKKLIESPTSHTQMIEISAGDLEQTRIQLSSELEELKDTVKIKDSEIEKLKTEISNLKTLVEIEALKTELAHLKILAAQENSKRKTKRK